MTFSMECVAQNSIKYTYLWTKQSYNFNVLKTPAGSIDLSVIGKYNYGIKQTYILSIYTICNIYKLIWGDL